MIPVTPDGRMCAADAAKYTGLEPKTLAIYRSYGAGPPFVKLGRIWYFKQDLDTWIQSRRVQTTAELHAKVETGAISKTRLVRKKPVPKAKVGRRVVRRKG